MRTVAAFLTAVAFAALAPGSAQATNWITMGPYPTKESCEVDKNRYHVIYPAWGCYQNGTDWYFQYNKV
ncbi:hypothetical protein [Saccharothrix yanglingensis]|uniref:Secreted protein n=1 Tax=Saccharothrix yanglingensis TaxID=659496 RepID=A0ABU0X4K2_9PSEU|nr:hypothetical protein [Saccharothrix yanglingensis]MDQ2586638.1 hypothetical protein [Saccharothrix yanglingensis]